MDGKRVKRGKHLLYRVRAVCNSLTSGFGNGMRIDEFARR